MFVVVVVATGWVVVLIFRAYSEQLLQYFYFFDFNQLIYSLEFVYAH